MKVQSKELSSQERMETLDALYTAASTIRGRDATKHFLRDLLTESERIMLGRRILIARALLSGHTYEDITERLQVGRDTIARVDIWIDEKSGDYAGAVKAMRKEYKARDTKRVFGELRVDTSFAGSLTKLKKKYPLHFLLFPWPKKYRDRI